MNTYPQQKQITSTAYRPVALKAKEHMQIGKVAKNQPSALPVTLSADYVIDHRFGQGGYLKTENGGKAVALRHKTEDKVIIAFSAFELSDPDDYNDTHNGGKEQWEAMKEEVHAYQRQLSQTTLIEKTGHSLGGGIAQHAVHDDMAPDSEFKDRHIQGYGYDAVGAANHMEDPERLKGKMRHVLVKGNDFHTVSGPHAGDEIYGLEPSHAGFIRGDLDSHASGGIDESLEEVLRTGKGLDEDYQPVYEQDTVVGHVAKELSDFPESFDKIKEATASILDHFKTPLLKQSQQNHQPSLEEVFAEQGHPSATQNGTVKVKAHTRNGQQIKAHTRTAPDGDEGNNFSRRR